LGLLRWPGDGLAGRGSAARYEDLGLAVVVSHKRVDITCRFAKGFLVEALEEEATGTVEQHGFDDQHLGDGGGGELHGKSDFRA
jgi:hypothetical protein